MKPFLLLLLGATTVLANDAVKDWTRIFGSPAQDGAARVCVDADWNAYVCGSTLDSFGGQTISTPGTSDLCLAKYTLGGTRSWLRLWGSPYRDYATGVACAPDGSIYVAGTTYGEFDGQSNQVPSWPDLCLSKFTPTGTRLWSRIWGSDDYDYGGAIAISSDGFVYVAGRTYGQFGGQTNVNQDFDYEDFCLTKFTPEGSQLWTRMWGSWSGEESYCACIDPVGNILVGGISYREFGGQTNPSPGYESLCLTKYTPDGNQLWARIWGSPWEDYLEGVCTDPMGNVYAAGTVGGSVGGQPAPSDYCPSVTKLSSAGSQQWVRIWGANGGAANDISIGSDGTLFIAGSAYPPSAPRARNGLSYPDLALYSVNSAGGDLWSYVWGSPTYDYANGLALDSGDNVYVAGTTGGAFDGQQNAGGNDIVLTRFLVPEPAATSAAALALLAPLARRRMK